MEKGVPQQEGLGKKQIKYDLSIISVARLQKRDVSQIRIQL